MSRRSRDRLSVLPAPPRPRGRKMHNYPPPEEAPLRCVCTRRREDGERIFAIEGGNLTTGGMTETELREVVATFEAAGPSPEMRRTLEVIKAALEAE